MSALKLYGVRDMKAAGYTFPPIAEATHGAAIRFFRDLVDDKSGPIGKHPEDYQLMYLGEFDQESGVLTPVDVMVLSQGSDFVAKAPKLVNEA